MTTAAKPANEFLDELWESFMPLHKVAEIQTRQFFAEKGKDKEALENFFHIRLSNERMNMIELSKKVSELPALTNPEECRLLSKQAWDEAEHFRIVYEVLEHLTGEKPNLEKIWETYGKVDVRMGASLVQKYEAHGNPIMMHLYQYMQKVVLPTFGTQWLSALATSSFRSVMIVLHVTRSSTAISVV